MDKNNRVLGALGLIVGSGIIYGLLQYGMCFEVMIDYTKDPNSGCTSVLNAILAPIFAFPVLIAGLLLMAHTLSQDEQINDSTSSTVAVPSHDDFRSDAAGVQRDLGWAIVSISGVFFGAVIVLGGGLLLLVMIGSGLSNSGNNGPIDLWYTLLMLIKISFLVFIAGLVMVVRPWKYIPENKDGVQVESKERSIQVCPTCKASIRFPIGYLGSARCPSCAYIFEGSSSEE
ncbi:MAG: hypothetical protein ACKVIR_08335 [Candidatus Poseidoniales archaeon]